MPTFKVEKTEINIFKTGDQYFFKEYFEQGELFDQLRKYYNSNKYRFEVLDEDLKEVKQILEQFFYDLTIITDLEEYCVVAEQDKDPTEMLRKSVATQYRGQYRVFLLKDKLSVRQAVEEGAQKAIESEINVENFTW